MRADITTLDICVYTYIYVGKHIACWSRSFYTRSIPGLDMMSLFLNRNIIIVLEMYTFIIISILYYITILYYNINKMIMNKIIFKYNYIYK